jgi:N-acetylglucosaminyldiphosphoundecaprenol N-acetyl-beta-D-mannosaminyltransferase
MDCFNFAGVKFTRLGLKSCAANAIEAIKARKKFVVAVPSSRMVSYAQEDKAYRNYVNHADLVIPDSISIVLASRLSKTPLKERVAGPDFMLELCRLASIEGYRVYLLGTIDSTLVKLSAKLKERFPKLNISGSQSLPFGNVSEMGAEEIIEKINIAKPDILFVGMSAPKQEFWLKKNIHRLNAYVYAGVGAAFDFHADRVRRAPVIFRTLGLEWLFRNIVDPNRKIRNVVKSAPNYLYLIFILFIVNHRFFLRIYIFYRVMVDDGFFRAFYKALRQFVKYDKRYIFVRKFSRKIKPDSHLEYIELDQDYLTNIQYDKSINCVEKFWNLTNGADRCFGCFENGRLIHISWVFHSGCSSIDLCKDEAFIGPCITFENSRKGGVYKNMLIYLSNKLRDEGYKRIYGSTNYGNLPSINGLMSADFRILHSQRNFFILSKKFYQIRANT